MYSKCHGFPSATPFCRGQKRFPSRMALFAHLRRLIDKAWEMDCTAREIWSKMIGMYQSTATHAKLCACIVCCHLLTAMSLLFTANTTTNYWYYVGKPLKVSGQWWMKNNDFFGGCISNVWATKMQTRIVVFEHCLELGNLGSTKDLFLSI